MFSKFYLTWDIQEYYLEHLKGGRDPHQLRFPNPWVAKGAIDSCGFPRPSDPLVSSRIAFRQTGGRCYIINDW